MLVQRNRTTLKRGAHPITRTHGKISPISGMISSDVYLCHVFGVFKAEGVPNILAATQLYHFKLVISISQRPIQVNISTPWWSPWLTQDTTSCLPSHSIWRAFLASLGSWLVNSFYVYTKQSTHFLIWWETSISSSVKIGEGIGLATGFSPPLDFTINRASEVLMERIFHLWIITQKDDSWFETPTDRGEEMQFRLHSSFKKWRNTTLRVTLDDNRVTSHRKENEIKSWAKVEGKRRCLEIRKQRSWNNAGSWKIKDLMLWL